MELEFSTIADERVLFAPVLKRLQNLYIAPPPPPQRGESIAKFGVALHTLPMREGTLTKISPLPPGRPPSTSPSPEEAEKWATNYGQAPPRRGLDKSTLPPCTPPPLGGTPRKIWVPGDDGC